MRIKELLFILPLFVFLSCAEEESDLDVVVPDELYVHFTNGATSCAEIRNPGDDGVNKDIEGPYTVQIRNLKLVWKTRHALAINLIQLRFDHPDFGGNYSQGLDLQEVDYLFRARSSDTESDNALLWVDKLIQPPLGDGSAEPPYELSTISDCVVAFGQVDVKDERATVTVPAELIIRAQKLIRDKNGELTGEEEPVNKYIPITLIYDPN